MESPPRRLVVYCDGAAEPNPGPAGIGGILLDERGKAVAQFSRSIGESTNNQAEYRALIAALEMALELGAAEVEIRSDSQLLVSQVCGRYRVRNAALRPLWQRTAELLRRFHSYTIRHIPRGQNRADALSRRF
ncbi:MAG TPA: ribonuclease HI family protein [Dehalococcoidia bacterium]|jgi:probable phosphoglycerate mutase|nr:ribonuclease HI family protein [Dehalococcoidia bacterium]